MRYLSHTLLLAMGIIYHAYADDEATRIIERLLTPPDYYASFRLYGAVIGAARATLRSVVDVAAPGQCVADRRWR